MIISLTELQKKALLEALYRRISKKLTLNRMKQGILSQSLRKKSDNVQIEKLKQKLHYAKDGTGATNQ